MVTKFSNKDLNDNEQETYEMQFDNYALKTNVLAFASRSKVKAKPHRRTFAKSSKRTLPIGERGLMLSQKISLQSITVSKQLSALLRHGHLPREDEGANEF